MQEGILRLTRDRVELRSESSYLKPIADVAVFYGMSGKLRAVLRDYREAGRKAVHIDLGYWGRHQGGRRAGYHKVTINDRHPTAYFQNQRHTLDRFEHFKIPILPWRKDGKNILVAGISAKGSIFEGWAPMGWERDAIDALKKITKRPIMYRSKPSDKQARPIPGVLYSPPAQPLADALANAYCVVAHHSNVVVDGLLAGIPGFTMEGVAAPMCLQDLRKIEQPLYPDDRRQWAADVAWCQWNVAEMANGSCWKHLKNEGLVP
jgi:hypothetical protein